MRRSCLVVVLAVCGSFPVPLSAQATKSPTYDLRAEIEKTGLSREKRIVIWKEFCAADDRATWEANRLFDPTDEFMKLNEYVEERTDRYRAEVQKKHHLTREASFALTAEAAEEGREQPEYPSCDVQAVARAMKWDVYANAGVATYHRRTCQLLESGGKILKWPLSRVIGDPRWRACTSCNP